MPDNNMFLLLKVISYFYLLKVIILGSRSLIARIPNQIVRSRIDFSIVGLFFLSFWGTIYLAMTRLDGLAFLFSYLMFVVALVLIFLADTIKPSLMDILGVFVFAISYMFFNLYRLIPI